MVRQEAVDSTADDSSERLPETVSARRQSDDEMLAAALELAEKSYFNEASRVLAESELASFKTLASLYHGLDAYLQPRGSVELLRVALDDIARDCKASVLFTTWTPAPEGAGAFLVAGDGRAGITARSVCLETVTLQTIKAQLRHALPEARCVVVHLLLHLQSNVGNSFYLKLVARDGQEEAVRIRRSEMTLCSLSRSCETDASVPTLLTVAMSGDALALFVNGRLQLRKRRVSGFVPVHVSLELLGDRSADLGATVDGFEVWTCAGLADFFDADSSLTSLHLEAALQSLDTDTVSRILSAIDDTLIERLPERLDDLLERLLTVRPYRPGMFEQLLSRVPQAQAAAWRARNGHRLPARVMSVRDVVVRFATEPNRYFALGRILRRRPLEWFNVLENVNFEIYEGDILGIIGENGAGKSTLLRTLCGLIPLKAGCIEIDGRPVLMKAGVGFREEMTGRENIFLAGAFLGMDPRDMRALVDEIVDFSELPDAIDRPMKYYSDGMKSRLMFSLATSLAPEILVLDEPLSAGDARFRDKALARMDEVMKKARVVVIVTHGVDFVRNKCTKALYLVKGQQRYFGDPGVACNQYLNDLHLSGSVSYA